MKTKWKMMTMIKSLQSNKTLTNKSLLREGRIRTLSKISRERRPLAKSNLNYKAARTSKSQQQERIQLNQPLIQEKLVRENRVMTRM